MSFEIKLDGGDDQLRKAFRTRVPGLAARFRDRELQLDVKDLSASGFAVLEQTGAFKEGERLAIDLLIRNKLFLGDVGAEVMRVLDNGIVGMNFLELDRQKQTKLDKLVLEVQKRLIELRKKQREE
ncbi:PilZ domain-containing protein [Pseudodesulfovibrio tunisiensis]|uniref:PilZ domain-containing protein n=1 Tax=Pseudodesulfovibrio tunisiensis TaxID=463192 RepID=UPI001FB3B8ED|nr:PilZ domain-containing protein [Pseudodesulfovibrio tunisiensis]